MTVREVFRFEIEYRLRQPSTWVYALVLFGIPFLMMHAINGSSQFLNAPTPLMQIMTTLGSLGMLVTAGIFGDAAARDVHSRMHSLFYTSPLRERDYLIGRFLGGLAVNAVLLLGIPLALLLASVMPYMEEGKFGPVQIAAYSQPYFLLLLPNLVIIGTFMFAAAAMTRQSLATYVGGILLLVLGLVAGELFDASANPTLVAMASPFGAGAIAQATEYWTPVELNARLIGWPPVLLLNRGVWLAISIGVFALLVVRFRFAHPAGAVKRRWWQRRVVADVEADRDGVPVAPLGVTDAHRNFSAASRLRQTLAVAARTWREIAATRAFLVILVGAILLMFALGWEVGAGSFGTFSWPVTHLIAGTVLSSSLAPVMALLIAIFAGEAIWRERDVGMGDIAAVAPIPNWVALLGRFLALVAMLVTLQLVFIVAGVLLQTMRGYDRYELDVYLKLLLGIKLVDYVLLSALAVAAHVIVNNKFLGHLVVVVYFATTMAAGLLGIENKMLIYASDPGWIWSDLNGLAPFISGLVWFKLYWAAWALLLGVLAGLFWVRGREITLRGRLTLARQRLAGPALRAIAVALVLIVSLGGFLVYNTQVLNEYESKDDVAVERAVYERRYKRFQGAAKPSVIKATLRVEIYPKDRAAEIGGVLGFVNRTGRSIDTLHVLPSYDVETQVVEWNRAARLAVNDTARRYRIYVLEQPLAPGDSIDMTFEVESRPRGFRNAGAPTAVTVNGAYFDRSWLPALGYLPGRELNDEKVRREQGLPPKTQPPSAGDIEAREAGPNERIGEPADVETIIGTDLRQTAVTPGTLVREWQENGRRYFHYRTDAPTSFGAAILSAEYSVHHDRWNGVPLRVYFHPTHDMNVERMIRSMKASLAYYTRHFGPYQFRELRIVEFPRYASFARAHPHTIAFSEGSAFLTRVDSGDVDRPFFVVAHETAHQWWGGQVVPASAAGAGMVSETLAQYSSMMVLESEYGPKMARQFYDWNMNTYFQNRTVYTNREVPLLDVVSHPYLHYYKGAVAMYTLRELVGADSVNAALRRFRDMHVGAKAPPATSRALYRELQAVTPDSLTPLLSDLFEHITLWSMRTDSVRADPVGDGTYRVSLFVDVSKVRADSIGRQTPTPMNDLIEVGAFAAAEGGDGGKPLYLKQHRLQAGKQVIQLTLPSRPARAGLDPYKKMIERERDDNVVDVVGGGGGVKKQ